MMFFGKSYKLFSKFALFNGCVSFRRRSFRRQIFFVAGHFAAGHFAAGSFRRQHFVAGHFAAVLGGFKYKQKGHNNRIHIDI